VYEFSVTVMRALKWCMHTMVNCTAVMTSLEPGAGYRSFFICCCHTTNYDVHRYWSKRGHVTITTV